MLPEFIVNRKTYLIIGIVFTVVCLFGFSFSYFTRESLSGNTSNNTIDVSTISQTSQSFITTYDNSSNELITGILNFDSDPYRKISKFKVENIYDDEFAITINWAFVTSSLIQEDSAYYLYECDTLALYSAATISNAASTCTLISPTTGNYLPNTGQTTKLQSADEITMQADEIKYFVLIANIGTSNEGKSFQGIVKVKDRFYHNLTLELDGGEISSTTSMDLKSGDTITIPIPTKTGYAFNGWIMTEGLDSNILGSSFTMGTTDTVIQAEWTPNTYTIAYNCNGGSGTTVSGTHTYDTAKNLTSNQCYNIIQGSSGQVYKFMGWSETSTGAVEYSNSQSVINLAQSGTKTLYAVWSGLFTFNGNYNVISDNAVCTGCWRIKFYSDGTFSSLLNLNIDIFLVGGGGGGATGLKGASSNGVGGGGGGGYTKTDFLNIAQNSSYSVIIGAGGLPTSTGTAGGASSFGSISVAGGQGGCRKSANCGGSGGSGGSTYYGQGGSNGQNGANYSTLRGMGQGETTCEFKQGNENGCYEGVTLYAGGGTAGTWNASRLAGGAGGGGEGGASDGDGMSGVDYLGGGGGGGGGGDTRTTAAGKGGKGIVIIRNSR